MALFFQDAFDAFKTIGDALIGNAEVGHGNDLDLKIEHVRVLQKTLKELSSALEVYISGEANHENSNLFEFFNTDIKTEKDNHPKRILSKAFLDSSKTLGSKSPLAQGLHKFGSMLSFYATSYEKYILDFNQNLLQPMKKIYDNELQRFFDQLEELNQFKSNLDAAGGGGPLYQQYKEKQNHLKKLANSIMKKENKILLSALVKVITDSKKHFEECFNMANTYLTMIETIKSNDSSVVKKQVNSIKKSFKSIISPRISIQSQSKSLTKQFEDSQRTEVTALPESLEVAKPDDDGHDESSSYCKYGENLPSFDSDKEEQLFDPKAQISSLYSNKPNQ